MTTTMKLALMIGCAVAAATTSFAQSPSDPASVASQAAQANVINWNTIILAFISLLTTIATTVGGIYLVKIKAGQDGLTKVTNDTHTLVNNNMAVQLKVGMELADFRAMTTGLPDHLQAAKYARTLYEEHMKKQAIVDRGGRNA